MCWSLRALRDPCVVLCDLGRVCINCVLDQRKACSIQGRPVIINKLPVPAEMPPGSLSAPPPFPWGLSGHLPTGKALFCSITANAVVCHSPSASNYIFKWILFNKIKRKWKIIQLRRPLVLCFLDACCLTFSTLCSFLESGTFGRARKASVNCLRAEHVVWITSLVVLCVWSYMHGCFIF